MKKTNICIAGNFDLAIKCTEFVKKKFKNIDLYAVFNSNDDGKDKFQRSFKKYCKNKIKITCVNIKEAYLIPDLIFISLHYDKIIKTENFHSKKLFNIHFSLLPKYKGMHTTAWPILCGEKFSGVTLHEIDNGIDTGNIISQIKFKININDNAEKVFLNYIKYGIILFKKNILKLLNGNYKLSKQKNLNSSYYSRASINFKKINIDLNKTAFEVHNQIRAFVFQHYQLPIIKGYKVINSKILKSKSKIKPGKIVSRVGKILKISTIDYNLLLKIK
jgi:methionyl-tRNA formyltransferase